MFYFVLERLLRSTHAHTQYSNKAALRCWLGLIREWALRPGDTKALPSSPFLPLFLCSLGLLMSRALNHIVRSPKNKLIKQTHSVSSSFCFIFFYLAFCVCVCLLTSHDKVLLSCSSSHKEQRWELQYCHWMIETSQWPHFTPLFLLEVRGCPILTHLLPTRRLSLSHSQTLCLDWISFYLTLPTKP